MRVLFKKLARKTIEKKNTDQASTYFNKNKNAYRPVTNWQTRKKRERTKNGTRVTKSSFIVILIYSKFC